MAFATVKQFKRLTMAFATVANFKTTHNGNYTFFLFKIMVGKEVAILFLSNENLTFNLTRRYCNLVVTT